MQKKNVIRRHQYADYLNVGTEDTADFVLMGAGFTTLDEEPGAQSESVKYVNEVSSSSSVISYETTFPFEAEQIQDEKAIDAIYKVGRNHLVGSDAEFEYVRVELWNKDGTSGNKFAARKFNVSVEVSTFEGENKMVISGNLNAVGDPVLGTFDTTAKEFTAETSGE
ncbi:hypothetical protein INP51_13100 [Blautia liquoris]|uniref:Phage tail protein n=1 Tax=Blautia liquoris TaxID=2779518 RepID=A0A7M2REY8_9FIRM|nr:hypothetical protein [Blautia liquoris]QOV18913.1 hypothetical protein INP51_13100 [Blautia liquoris]